MFSLEHFYVTYTSQDFCLYDTKFMPACVVENCNIPVEKTTH
jgi:hypothetical protein